VSREATIARRLVTLYPSDRWAFVRHPRSVVGARREGERIADVAAAALWPSMGPRLHIIEIKDDPYDYGADVAEPAKQGAFAPYASAMLFAVMAPWQRVVKSKALLPPGRGLVSCGTGKPRIIVPPVEHAPERPLDPFVLALLRAAPRPGVEALPASSPAPVEGPGLRKILPRRMPKSMGSPVTKLRVALDVIEAASLDEFPALEAALAARRAA
jgi:hypothetical protein